MLIPYQSLSAEALSGLIEAYIIAQLDGTEENIDLQSAHRQVKQLIVQNELVIEFSQANESVAIKSRANIAFTDEE